MWKNEREHTYTQHRYNRMVHWNGANHTIIKYTQLQSVIACISLSFSLPLCSTFLSVSCGKMQIAKKKCTVVGIYPVINHKWIHIWMHFAWADRMVLYCICLLIKPDFSNLCRRVCVYIYALVLFLPLVWLNKCGAHLWWSFTMKYQSNIWYKIKTKRKNSIESLCLDVATMDVYTTAQKWFHQ